MQQQPVAQLRGDAADRFAGGVTISYDMAPDGEVAVVRLPNGRVSWHPIGFDIVTSGGEVWSFYDFPRGPRYVGRYVASPLRAARWQRALAEWMLSRPSVAALTGASRFGGVPLRLLVGLCSLELFADTCWSFNSQALRGWRSWTIVHDGDNDR